jgi:GT2 family glycosyltransferase
MRLPERQPGYTMGRVLIVIPVHNALSATIACLRSLAEAGQDLSDVLIVDNGSTDNTPQVIKAQFPSLTIVAQANRGFAAAVNVGLRMALDCEFQYTWILNSDTEITADTPMQLVTFMDCAENCRVGACAPLVFRADRPDEIDFAGTWFYRSNWTVETIHDPQLGQAALVDNADRSFLSGSSLFVRNQAVQQVGFFDDRFFMYWEDADFCIRLVNAGWLLRIVPSARVLHKGYASSGGSASTLVIYYFTRNRFLMCEKHSPDASTRRRTFMEMAKAIIFESANWKAFRHDPLAPVRVWALDHAIIRHFGKTQDPSGGLWAKLTLVVFCFVAFALRIQIKARNWISVLKRRIARINSGTY